MPEEKEYIESWYWKYPILRDTSIMIDHISYMIWIIISLSFCGIYIIVRMMIYYRFNPIKVYKDIYWGLKIMSGDVKGLNKYGGLDGRVEPSKIKC
jgi:hypothetical protein